MKHLSGYSKIYALGHREILGILDDPVIVQEFIYAWTGNDTWKEFAILFNRATNAIESEE